MPRSIVVPPINCRISRELRMIYETEDQSTFDVWTWQTIRGTAFWNDPRQCVLGNVVVFGRTTMRRICIRLSRVISYVVCRIVCCYKLSCVVLCALCCFDWHVLASTFDIRYKYETIPIPCYTCTILKGLGRKLVTFLETLFKNFIIDKDDLANAYCNHVRVFQNFFLMNITPLP